jgi:(2Fe-2S) ferredoxin
MTTELYYDAHVFCCVNQREANHPRGCCQAKGADRLRDYMKKRATALGLGRNVRINQSGCLDRCDLGPVLVIYPQGEWYRYENEADIDAILTQCLLEGGAVPRLRLDRNDANLADWQARQG